MIKNIFRRIGSIFRDGSESRAIHDEIIKNRAKDIQELQRVNKKVRLLLSEGHVEIVIKNVRGVIEEDYKEKKRK